MVLFAVALAAAVVLILGLAALALVVMIAADAAAAWPAKPRHRRSPGVQLWARSVETDTAAVVICPEGRRL